MLFNRAITKGLTTKLKNHEFPYIWAVNIVILSIITFLNTNPVQASFSPKSDSIKPLNRFPRMVQEYFVKSIRRVEQQANTRRAALKTRADAQTYVNDISEKIQQSFGPWPEKTPLKPRITGVIDRDQYKIEKIIFESRPNFLVTARGEGLFFGS